MIKVEKFKYSNDTESIVYNFFKHQGMEYYYDLQISFWNDEIKNAQVWIKDFPAIVSRDFNKYLEIDVLNPIQKKILVKGLFVAGWFE